MPEKNYYNFIVPYLLLLDGWETPSSSKFVPIY